MIVLGNAIAARFGLTVTRSNSLTAIKDGGITVINVGGNRGSYKGVFSDGGHYIICLGRAPDGRLILIDPYLYDGKYNKSHRKIVEVAGNILYAAPEIVDKDAENRTPRYTIFTI